MSINFTDFAPVEEFCTILGNGCYHILSSFYDDHKQKFYFKVEAAFKDEEVARNAFGRFYAGMHYILIYRGGNTSFFMNQGKIEWYQNSVEF